MNNPNTASIEMTQAQQAEYAVMQERETNLRYLAEKYPDSDIGWHDKLTDQMVKMERYLEDIGITDY